MKKQHFPTILTFILFLVLLLAACTPAAATLTEAATPIAQPETTVPPAAMPTETNPPATLPPTTTPATTVPAEETPDQAAFPLSESGPYYAGTTSIKLVDPSRDNREVDVSIYYPALKQENAEGQVIRRDAAADMSGAPYPLILTGPNSGDMLFLDHLASHAFVMAIVRFPDLDYSDNWDYGVIDHPQDMVFVLDQLATNPPEVLDGVVDTETTGVTGYSWDGFFSLALSGVRIDPEFYLSWCDQAPTQQPPLDEWYIQYACELAGKWDEFVAHVGEEITTSEDGLWVPITDERIRVVMPMAADGAWLYGERGLEAVDRLVFMIQAENDSPYQPTEAAFIFDNLPDSLKSMVTFLDKEHMMVFEPESAARIRHFVTAYFGYYLQGREEYKQYLSEDFVKQFDDLAWGMVPGD